MKNKNLFKFTLAFSFMLFMFVGIASAANPAWSNNANLDKKTTHIFLPKQNVYFALSTNEFIFEEGGVWKTAVQLPVALQRLNLYAEPQMEIQTKKGTTPYQDNVSHRQTYIKETKSEYNALLKEQKEDLKEVQKSVKELKKEEKARKKEMLAEKKRLKAEQKVLKQQEKAQKAIEKAEKREAKLQKKLIKAEKQRAKAEKKVNKLTK